MTVSVEQAQKVLRNANMLYSRQDVEAAFDRIASEATKLVGEHNPLVLCVMSGGLIPTSELLLRFDFPLQLDYLHATRYQGGTRGSALDWIAYPSHSLENRTVLVIDDILDEGLTLAAVIQYCQKQGAANVYSAVLVEKHHARRVAGVKADLIGLQVDDHYVFGYGMDYHGYLRNIKGIYAVSDQ